MMNWICKVSKDRLLHLGLLLFVFSLSSCSSEDKVLPVLGNARIPAFKFVNQDSLEVTDKDFDNHIYVADFFFTSCPTICPTMHRNLKKVYDRYKGNEAVKLLSHTIDVKYDTPSRLKRYANKLGVEGTQWEFLWGSRDSIYSLAQNNYLVAVQEDKAEPGGFVHAGYLVLVDKQKRLRGAYDGTKDDQVAQLLKDMDIRLKEK